MERTHSRSLLPLPLVIDNQVKEDGFHEVAKPTAIGIRLFEVTTDKTNGKFLRHLVSGVSVTQRTKQITVNGAKVEFQKLMLSQRHTIPRAAVRLSHQRPTGGNAAQAVTQLTLIHTVSGLVQIGQVSRRVPLSWCRRLACTTRSAGKPLAPQACNSGWNHA